MSILENFDQLEKSLKDCTKQMELVQSYKKLCYNLMILTSILCFVLLIIYLLMRRQINRLMRIHYVSVEIKPEETQDTARSTNTDRQILICEIKNQLDKYIKFQNDGNFSLKEISEQDKIIEEEIQSTFRSNYDLNTIIATPRSEKVILDIKNTKMLRIFLKQLYQLLQALNESNTELTPDLQSKYTALKNMYYFEQIKSDIKIAIDQKNQHANIAQIQVLGQIMAIIEKDVEMIMQKESYVSPSPSPSLPQGYLQQQSYRKMVSNAGSNKFNANGRQQSNVYARQQSNAYGRQQSNAYGRQQSNAYGRQQSNAYGRQQSNANGRQHSNTPSPRQSQNQGIQQSNSPFAKQLSKTLAKQQTIANSQRSGGNNTFRSVTRKINVQKF